MLQEVMVHFESIRLECLDATRDEEMRSREQRLGETAQLALQIVALSESDVEQINAQRKAKVPIL
jgi:hypothetical protein